jgi:protein TonB
LEFGEQQRNPGRHAMGFGIVVALHALAGWALITGLAQRMVEVIKSPIETKIIDEVRPPPPPPPENLPPPPKFQPPPPSYVPPPEVNVSPPPQPAPTITTVITPPPPAPVTIAPAPPPAPAPPAPAAPPPAPRVAAQPAVLNVRSCAPRNEDYPAAALRAEATGMTVIRFTVGPDGKVESSQIVRSAGPSREHKMLDRVAQAKLSECTFKPGIDENGRAVGGTTQVEFVWKIE